MGNWETGSAPTVCYIIIIAWLTGLLLGQQIQVCVTFPSTHQFIRENSMVGKG